MTPLWPPLHVLSIPGLREAKQEVNTITWATPGIASQGTGLSSALDGCAYVHVCVYVHVWVHVCVFSQLHKNLSGGGQGRSGGRI